MIWKSLKQNVLFPKGLNSIQRWVSLIGLFSVTWVSGPPPKLFLHVWFLNHIEKVKKFTGKDKQIGLFAKDMKKKVFLVWCWLPAYSITWKRPYLQLKLLWKTKPCVNFKVQISKNNLLNWLGFSLATSLYLLLWINTWSQDFPTSVVELRNFFL